MTGWKWIKAWLRRKNKPASGVRSNDVLREFVYLDDVSVDSLVASVKGGTLEHITSTAGSEVQSELGAKAGSSMPVATAEVRSRLQTTTSEALQTLRRAGIQARFRELHEIVKDRRVIRPPEGSDGPSPVESITDLRSLATGADRFSWAVRVDTLCRGAIVELDIELGTEPLFHMASAMSQILDLWPADPRGVGLDEIPEVGQAREICRMISSMLGGLVPIRSRAIDYSAVDVDGETWLVHRKLLDQLPPALVARRRPIAVVAVAAEDRFWKDQRRVVFAGARYRILARLVADGTSESWTPVKMMDTFKGLVPGFSEAINDLSRKSQLPLAIPNRRPDPVAPNPGEAAKSPVSYALLLMQTYAQRLGGEADVIVDPADLEEAGLIVGVEGDLPSLENAAALLGPVTVFVEGLSKYPIDPVVVSDTRLRAYRQVEADVSTSQSTLVELPFDDTAETLLEVELVAVYW